MATPITHTAIPSSANALLLLGRGVMIETIRRKEFYVLLIFMAIYMTGILIAGIVGVENEQTLVFLLNLGISFAYLSSHLLALLTGARQIPFEIENRTIYPLLAKPLSRENYLFGKWAAVTAAGLAVFAVLLVMSYLPWFFFPKSPSLSIPMMVQAVLVSIVSLGMISALSLLGSLVMPQGVNVTLLGLWFLVGSTAKNLVEARAMLSGNGEPLKWVLAYLPDFGLMNLFTRYTDGIGPLDAMQFLGLLAYGAIFTGCAMALSAISFNKRPL
ncbi:ABC transporter permease subunit [bacterium]|nr:ABC transporter permease subunit [bacterium]